MMIAAITPGTQPQQVSIVTITTLPQPLSSTDSGGKMIQSKTRMIPILFYLYLYKENISADISILSIIPSEKIFNVQHPLAPLFTIHY